MTMQSVSVIVCTYNGERYIQDQLFTILNQTYPIKEILVFDDASTDRTQDILEKFASAHPVVSVIKNEKNCGFTKNFEQGVKAASGDIIAISDQDDIWELNKIEKMLSLWPEESPLIYCNSVRFTDEVPNCKGEKSFFRRFFGTDINRLCVFNTISGHSILFRKTFLSLILPFREGIMYDWWMGAVAGVNGGVSYCPDTLVYQRVHSSNVTVEKGYELTKDKVQNHKYKEMVLRHLLEFQQIPGVPAVDKRFFKELSILWEKGLQKKFSVPLFIFLVKNGKIVFWWKKEKLFSFISILKHSFRLTKN